MESNKNIFCVSNPAKILDGLWRVISESGYDLVDMLIFVPNRRAVRSVEKMIADKMGGAAILPHLVPLGEGVDDNDTDGDDDNVISELERVVAMSYLIAGLPTVRTISAALPVARTLITMQDYLENSCVDISDIDWNGLVDEKYARHFRDKAELLTVLGRVQHEIYNGRETGVRARNRSIDAWGTYIQKMPVDKSLIIVCGSTASVPVARKLMARVASMSNGRIILSGRISGVYDDFMLDTHPYNSEYEFLVQIGVAPSDVRCIDVGVSHIDFMNRAFGNSVDMCPDYDLSNCHLIVANRESEEAACVAEIAARAIDENKSVLVITPDAAGNQRLLTEFLRRNIVADFSGGLLGVTPAGRAILNIMDDWIDAGDDTFQKIYYKNNCDLFDTIADIVQNMREIMSPKFDASDDVSIMVWEKIKELSECLNLQNIHVNVADARAFIADALSGVRVRGKMNDGASVVVLGTIESRMQTADVVILTGLNEGMFPATGYENPWLPRSVADKIGLPSPNHKVSLMALDFMNLSCGANVYWTRSRLSGGTQTQESRFLSRVIVARGKYDTSCGIEILDTVRARDVVAPRPLFYGDPTPPSDWSDVYVTDLEYLIHNPYAFYVRHILRIAPIKDYWESVDARDFGNMVHDVLEHAPVGVTREYLISEMDRLARERLGNNNLIFNFWHRRFVEIADVAKNMLDATVGASVEIGGVVRIAGRNVRARADRIWDGGVLDIKTGAAPTNAQLAKGNMPQLPLEALMLSTGGFKIPTSEKSRTPIMQFLQLKNGDVRLIEYSSEQTAEMMRVAHERVQELFNIYSAGGAGYEYRPNTDQKYRGYDDFARAEERD